MGEKGIRDGVLEDYGWSRMKRPWERSAGDHRHAFNPDTGQNAHWDPNKGQWTDSKTGEAATPSVYK